MQPEAMAGAVEKVRSGGSADVAVTERGTFFGYGDLVVDMRNFARLRAATGAPVIFDATHAVQQPGQGDGRCERRRSASTSRRCSRPRPWRAPTASSSRRIPIPPRALSDAATQWPLDRLDALVGADARPLGPGA